MNIACLIECIRARLTSCDRMVLAIAGPPASGKSTLAQVFAEQFSGDAVVLPMDGFHFDNLVLRDKGLFARKGAPETFDVGGFFHTLQRISVGEVVYAPQFDRTADLARAGAIEISSQRLVIVEGNYLLYDAPSWDALVPFWHYSVWVEVSLEMIAQRLVQRWVDHGLSIEDARRRAEENDLRNARDLLDKRIAASVSMSLTLSQD